MRKITSTVQLSNLSQSRQLRSYLDKNETLKLKKHVSISLKVTRPSYFVRIPSYFEALWHPHLYFDRKSSI